MFSLAKFGNDLYTGKRSFNVVGRRMMFFLISGVLMLCCALAIGVKGINLGIDFTGGTRYTVTVEGTAGQNLADDLRSAVGDLGFEETEGATVATAGDKSVVIETKPIDSNSDEDEAVITAIEETADVDEADISRVGIGPTWGERVAKSAITGLIVFLILVILFIWAYFREWKMSVSAVVALLHDIAIAVGVYAVSGFEVTPATVTGFLTILGFSLYDTVVVFDKVRENTKNLRRTHQSYADAANLAVNQTLVRSINTSVVALLPVAAILYVSAVQLGTSSLKDISLVLFVGMAAGTYSSVVIATPLLVQLKSGEKEVKDAERHAKARMRDVDPYADVPAFAEEKPVADVPEDPDELRDGDDDSPEAPGTDGDPAAARTGGSVKRSGGEPLGRGRTAPAQHAPVEESKSSGRRQPKRQPRSKRGK